MSKQRGRIRISGFDSERVRRREASSTAADADERETESRWRRGYRRFRRNRSAMLGVYVVLGLVLLTVFARPIEIFEVTVQPFSIAPYDPNIRHDLFGTGAASYEPPSTQHYFGTDGSSRDIFSRVLYGGRYSISIGFIVVALTASFGLVYGGVSGYYGGWVDEVMMRIVDTIFAFPGLILALVIVAVLGGGYWQLVLAFSIFGWASYGRLVRGEVLTIKENEYVLAAKALGASDRVVITRHVLPNAMPPLLVVASLNIGTVVIGVAALGFLGLGLGPTSAEWGTMLDATRETLIQGPGGQIPWWATVFPGLAIFVFVMSMNMIGDGVNDALDAQETGVARGGDE
ncbi:ABC transporter permease [Natronomonas salina]|uniref:ABC transporter permease n=1 Tax=Natronomonas salina TaxID=1710540 RepID=UPI0015B7233B|nr:ABC transporter permease [Natronomonas salina]QLD90451.1 ABC transporter permease [Natronomonas salina]